LAISFGVLAGVMEAAQHWFFRWNPDVLTIRKVPPDGVFWVAPLVYVLLFLGVAVGCLILGKVQRRWPAHLLLLYACVFLAAYGQLTLTGNIHRVGAAIFAAGAAVALGRAMTRWPGGWTRLAWLAPVLAGTIALHWGGSTLTGIMRERNALAALPPATPGAPNVLLIVLDTVRADHLSLHGYPRATTPKLDQWARRGVIFDNAWSVSSWTVPAHASMLTGRSASEHGAGTAKGKGLNGRSPMLSEYFRDHGYRTAGFAGNTIFLIPEYGFDRGFLRWRSLTPWGIAAHTSLGQLANKLLSEKLGFHHLPVRRMASDINAEVLDWLDDTPGRPFFALLNYMDAHTPFWPPSPYDQKFKDPPPGKPVSLKGKPLNISSYDSMLAYLDDHLAALFGELEKRGLLANTLVLITSDHGESLGDHGRDAHGQRLYRELCRVPLIVVGPGVRPGARVESSASTQQIPATVAQLLDPHTPAPFPAPSFASLLKASPAAGLPADETALLELHRLDGSIASKSLVRGSWQYIWNARGTAEELFDLKADPQELNNLAADPAQRARLEEFRAELRRRFPELPLGERRAAQ
jgi:arylsulfatase A-like enzyme